MRVMMTKEKKAVILLEENRDIRFAIQILDYIRFRSWEDEQERTWALVTLDCIRRIK